MSYQEYKLIQMDLNEVKAKLDKRLDSIEDQIRVLNGKLNKIIEQTDRRGD